MQMNKSELSKVKGGGKLKKNGIRVTGYGARLSGYGLRITGFFLSFLFFFVFFSFPVSRYPLPASADSITIRTIVTPIGSQSEKWGAKGLMVCIGGEDISDGGCGLGVKDAYVIDDAGNKNKEEDFITDNSIIVFEDVADGVSSNPNHQYDYRSSWSDYSDTVYKVSGGGGSGCPTPYRVIGPFTGTNCTTECANAGHSCAFGQYYGHSATAEYYYIINCSSSVVNPAHSLYCACCDD